MLTTIFLALVACNGGPGPRDVGAEVAGETAGPEDTDASAPDSDPPGGDTEVASDTDSAPDPLVDPDLSDCVVTIFDVAQVVRVQTNRGDDGAVLWVCRNQTLSYSGDAGTVYLEQGAEVVVSGRKNVVYAVRGAEMHDFGAENLFVVADPGGVIDESETGATVQECPGLAFDYASAPSPGC